MINKGKGLAVEEGGGGRKIRPRVGPVRDQKSSSLAFDFDV